MSEQRVKTPHPVCPCRSVYVAGHQLRRWQVHTRLHRAQLPPTPLTRASDALPLTSTYRPTLLLVRPFAVLFQPCGLLRLLRPLLTSRSAFQRRAFTHKARSPQVRTRSFPAQPPDLRRLSLDHKSFANACPLALLGTAFYPVLVHRLAVSLHASSPQSVTLLQLRFASFAVVYLRRDLHPQDRAHAGRTSG